MYYCTAPTCSKQPLIYSIVNDCGWILHLQNFSVGAWGLHLVEDLQRGLSMCHREWWSPKQGVSWPCLSWSLALSWVAPTTSWRWQGRRNGIQSHPGISNGSSWGFNSSISHGNTLRSSNLTEHPTWSVVITMGHEWDSALFYEHHEATPEVHHDVLWSFGSIGNLVNIQATGIGRKDATYTKSTSSLSDFNRPYQSSWLILLFALRTLSTCHESRTQPSSPLHGKAIPGEPGPTWLANSIQLWKDFLLQVHILENGLTLPKLEGC